MVFFFVIEGKDKTLEEMDMMYVMRVKPWESSKWEPPAPEHQLTTAQLMDRNVAEGYEREEESASAKKQAEDPAHMHEEVVGGSSAGPSRA